MPKKIKAPKKQSIPKEKIELKKAVEKYIGGDKASGMAFVLKEIKSSEGRGADAMVLIQNMREHEVLLAIKHLVEHVANHKHSDSCER